MGGTQPIPEGLTQMAPGPELARVLADIDASRTSGFDRVEVLQAQYRQFNHETARLMAALVEVGLCADGPEDEVPARMDEPNEFSADEIRAALAWSRRAADNRLWQAHDLLARLPAVHAALDAGVIDEPKARVLREWTADLTTEQARAICDSLLPEAPGLVCGRLIEKIKKMVIAIDPDWARRRYETAVAERKVVGYRNPDGSANLSGFNLPLDQTVAAAARIDALAKAVKRAGHPDRIDHLRADLFLGMIDGSYIGRDDDAIIAMLLATARTDDDGAAGPDSRPGGHGPGERSEGDCSDQRHAQEGSDGDGPDECSGHVENGARGGRRSGCLEVRVRLSTLLGLDDCPGELAGWGPVHAELTRDLVRAHAGGQWRFALTDDAGRRLPGAVLRRYVKIRDRCCRFPTCRAPAHSADTDHSVDHAHGGATVDVNLGECCRHDHRLKHEGGWRLTQPRARALRMDQQAGPGLPGGSPADHGTTTRPSAPQRQRAALRAPTRRRLGRHHHLGRPSRFPA